MKFPQGKQFAFTILDDTDDSTLENVKPVYDALKTHGIRTTKTVWPVDCPEGSRIFFAADTLQRKPYLEFVRQLGVDGFEIAFHGATMESSRRDRTVQALDFLKAEFGAYPTLFCNHGHNRDNLYWGYKRFQTSWLRRMVGLLRKGFVKDGVLDPRVHRIFQTLSQKPGWYVPVSEMLDYLVQTQDKGRILGSLKTAMLETRYLVNKLWPAS